MPRPLRLEHPGVFYHITARGNARQRIFWDQRDRAHLRELLEEAVTRFHLRLFAYVFMANHYHLLLEVPPGNLSRAMQWLNVSYSAWFNVRHRQIGHLFQGRFKCVVVEPLTWAYSLSRYVHLNPVRTAGYGLDKSARRQQRAGVKAAATAEQVQRRIAMLRNYRWSSYRAYVGLEPAPDWLDRTEIFARTGRRGRDLQQHSYQQYVEEAVRDGLPESPWQAVQGQIILGDDEFVERMRERAAAGHGRLAEALARMPKFEQITAAVEKLKGEKWMDFRDRRNDWGRDLALYLARRHTGLKLDDLGRVCELDGRTVGWAVQRFTRRIANDEAIAAAVKIVTARITQ